jgi:hypothetical protein
MTIETLGIDIAPTPRVVLKRRVMRNQLLT